MVTAQYLLEGAFYAMEQCGLLLQHALILYENRAYSSAVALAAFAREEMGRARILFELRKNVQNCQTVSIEDIKDKCKDHVEKQEYAQLSIVLRSSGDTGLAELLRVGIDDPQSEEYKQARKQIHKITQRLKRRTPLDRHKERMNSLYVEPDELGTRWNRPRNNTPSVDAMNFILDALNDYRGEYHRLEYIEHSDTELFQALQAWCERPELPLLNEGPTWHG
jgi:AbiV family abortive infection protein